MYHTETSSYYVKTCYENRVVVLLTTVSFGGLSVDAILGEGLEPCAYEVTVCWSASFELLLSKVLSGTHRT